MSEQKQNGKQQPEGMVYPCEIAIKVFVSKDSISENDVAALVLKVLEPVDLLEISQNTSSKGNYISYSVKVYAKSQALMDAVFTELTQHPKIIMVI